jgi:hypothetical protein
MSVIGKQEENLQIGSTYCICNDDVYSSQVLNCVLHKQRTFGHRAAILNFEMINSYS